MKKLILLLLMIPLLSFSVTASSFCDGWKKGYKAGYCYQVTGCISPIVPTCPIAKVGENTYQDGYNRGFVAGRAAQ